MNVYFKADENAEEQLILANASVTEVQILRDEFGLGAVWNDSWSGLVESSRFQYGIDEDGDLYALFTAAD